MKTLEDVAKSFKKSAGEAIYPGFPYGGYRKTGSSKAFKTGNLLAKFVTSPNNQPRTIGRKVVNGYEFVLDVAPQGAEYGQYVHYGTKYMEDRPFAQIGANTQAFRTELDLFMIDKVDEMLDGFMEEIGDRWRESGFEVS
jgi:hypothetical protein